MLFFDIEANGLYDTVTKGHCMVIIDQFDTVTRYRPENMERGFKRLLEAVEAGEYIVGHNVIKYDIPTLEKLFPKYKLKRECRKYVIDTLVLSQLIEHEIKETDAARLRNHTLPPALYGRHSLKAWGYRLSELKGTYAQEHEEAWAEFNEDMLEYCVQDVVVTKKLYYHLTLNPYSEKAIRLEHDIQWVMFQQEQNGFTFDLEKANKLQRELEEKECVLHSKLISIVPCVPDKVFIPKRDNKTKGYKKGVPIQRYKDFNPGSRQQIDWLIKTKFNYVPENPELFEDERLKIDSTTFDFIKKDPKASEELRALAEVFAEYLMVSKRLGQLSTGTQAWLKQVKEDGRIHGSVNPCGARTFRASHTNPNVAQVPAIGSPYGKECRELFTVPDGWYQAGVDASGLELRCLAHYTYPYDNGAYAHEILNGDIHTANQKAAGLAERSQAKTFIYAFLYGAGDARIGNIVKGDAKEGKRLKKKFLEHTPAIKDLRDAIEGALIAETYHGQIVKWKRKWLKCLDGRFLRVTSIHSALNFLLQSAGAIICKKWVCVLEENLVQAGFDHGKDFQLMAWVHDEVQVACRTKEIAESVVKIAQDSMRQVQAFYGFRVQLDTEGKIGFNWADCH